MKELEVVGLQRLFVPILAAQEKHPADISLFEVLFGQVAYDSERFFSRRLSDPMVDGLTWDQGFQGVYAERLLAL